MAKPQQGMLKPEDHSILRVILVQELTTITIVERAVRGRRVMNGFSATGGI